MFPKTIADLIRGGLFLYPGDGDTKIIIIGMDTEGRGTKGSDPGGNLIVGYRPVFHFHWIAGIKAFGDNPQHPHAIPSNDGQQIKDAGAVCLLTRGYFFSDGAIIG